MLCACICVFSVIEGLISPAALEDFANACAVLKDFQGEAEKLVIMVENVHADHIPPNWYVL